MTFDFFRLSAARQEASLSGLAFLFAPNWRFSHFDRGVELVQDLHDSGIRRVFALQLRKLLVRSHAGLEDPPIGILDAPYRINRIEISGLDPS